MMSLVLAVIAFGWVGTLVVLGVSAVLVIIELWQESARLTVERDGERSLVAQRDEELRECRGHERAALARAEELPAAQDEIEQLEQQIQELRDELTTPRISFEQLLDGLQKQVALLDLILRHRDIQRTGLTVEWPVTRISLVDDGTACLEAVVGDDSERLRDEFVVLAYTGETEPMGFAYVSAASGHHVEVLFALDELPGILSEEVKAKGGWSPEGYALRLGALALYEESDTDTLEEVRGSARVLMETLAKALISTKRTSPKLEAGE